MARRDTPQDFHGIPARSGDHAVDELLGWRYDRQAISPAIVKILFDDIDGAPHRVQSGEFRRRFSGNHVAFPLLLAPSRSRSMHGETRTKAFIGVKSSEYGFRIVSCWQQRGLRHRLDNVRRD